jgi:hypothetical protein
VAWLAVGSTLYFGLASVVFPAEASSLGVAGGATAMATAASYAAGILTSGKAVAAPAKPAPLPKPLA